MASGTVCAMRAQQARIHTAPPSERACGAMSSSPPPGALKKGGGSGRMEKRRKKLARLERFARRFAGE
eukprot:8347579-Alexandrium_andersonii.AAC.1